MQTTLWLSRKIRLTGWMALLAMALAFGPAQAAGNGDWREKIEVFRIGLLATPGSGGAIAGLAGIKKAYAQALGVPVEILVADDYASLIDAHRRGSIDYAVYSATAYAAAWRLCDCVEPVAAPLGDDGATGVGMVLLVRKGVRPALSGRDDLTIAAGPPDGLTGAFAAEKLLAEAGLAKADSADVIRRYPTASEAEAAFASGETDGVLGWVPIAAKDGSVLEGGTPERLNAMGDGTPEFEIAWRSGTVRFGPHAVRRDLAAEAKQVLERFLLLMHGQDRDLYELVEIVHGGGFAAARHEDYDPVLEMLRLAAPGPDAD